MSKTETKNTFDAPDVPKGKVRLYGCGGAGTNLVKGFYDIAITPELADITVCMLDTSLSNIGRNVDPANYFVIPDVDGSGKIRKENYAEISSMIKQIPLQFKPEDLNIVVMSGSGGSGSVFGPLLVGELLASNANVIAVVVGSYESLIAAENTYKTLLSIDSISKKNKIPAVTAFYNNKDNSLRKDVDAQVVETISLLSILASRRHREMDTADVHSWLRYDRTTTVPAQLALLDITDKLDEVRNIAYPVSIATLVKDGESTAIGSIGADYQATGYSDPKGPIAEFGELHFVIGVNDVQSLLAEAAAKVAELTERKNARPKVIAADISTANDDGMLL